MAASLANLTPVSGGPGTAVTVDALGFLASHALTADIGGTTITITSGGTTDGSGNSHLSFAIPAGASPGAQFITVSDGTSSASVAFNGSYLVVSSPSKPFASGPFAPTLAPISATQALLTYYSADMHATVVEIASDGTVTAPHAVATIFTGLPGTGNWTNNTRPLVKLTATTFLTVLNDPSKNMVAAVLTVSGSTVSVGTLNTLIAYPGSGFPGPRWRMVALDSSHVMLSYADASNVVQVAVLTISGSTVTLGTPTVTAAEPYALIDSSHVLALWGTTVLNAAVLTVASGLVTVGTVTTLASGTSVDALDAIVWSTTSALGAFRSNASAHINYPQTVPITISGTTVTFGTAQYAGAEATFLQSSQFAQGFASAHTAFIYPATISLAPNRTDNLTAYVKSDGTVLETDHTDSVDGAYQWEMSTAVLYTGTVLLAWDTTRTGNPMGFVTITDGTPAPAPPPSTGGWSTGFIRIG